MPRAGPRDGPSSMAARGPKGGSATVQEEDPTIAQLWKLYCGVFVDVVSHSDPLVDAMWKLFFPVLRRVTLVPVLSFNSASLTGEVEVMSGPVPPVTHTFDLHLRKDASTGGGTGLVMGTSTATASPTLTSDMSAALQEQPALVVALLEFFVAVMEEQRMGNVADAMPHPPSGEASAHSPAPSSHHGKGPCRVFCILRGDPMEALLFDQLGASQLGRFITIKGTVVRMSHPRITCVRMAYRCGLCGAVKVAPAEDGVLVYPSSCAGRCRGFKWVPLVEQSVCEEVQLVKLQEQAELSDASWSEGASGSGGMSKVMEVELRMPLLDQVAVGEVVCISGILSTRRGERKAGNTQQICLHARSITGLHLLSSGSPRHPLMQANGGSTDSAAQMGWSTEESGKFYEMARHPQWFKRLSASVAPALFGLEMVKEAVLLAVVGGSMQKFAARSSIHLLLVGDPGLGKSQLLRAACSIAPRSALVCAHTSSSCGLTLTLSRDPISGETSFEAGAVVHGDGGITCIDEIDKGVAEHKALLEVMEQETVSIAKAGMVLSMPVHTSILAAGNPLGGHFDLSKPLSTNVNLSLPLLSRFDIIVCIRDGLTPRSGHLTSHVLQLHRQHAYQSGGHGGSDRETHMTVGSGGGAGPLSPDLVRRFIAFCRTQCQPMLRSEAGTILKSYYLHKRAKGVPQAMELPVTPRYLQALIRVAEARAKVELRHEVTSEDAQYAVNLLESCLGTWGPGDGSKVAGDGSVPQSRSTGKRTQRDKVVDLLKGAIVHNNGVNKLSRSTILEACEMAGCKNPQAMLQQLNEFGILLQAADKFTLRGV